MMYHLIMIECTDVMKRSIELASGRVAKGRCQRQCSSDSLFVIVVMDAIVIIIVNGVKCQHLLLSLCFGQS